MRILSVGCFLALLVTPVVTVPAHAQGTDDSTDDEMSGGGNLAEDSDDAPPPVKRSAKTAAAKPARGRHPGFVTEPTAWIGARHKFTKDFYIDVFTKTKASIRSGPYRPSSTDFGGGFALGWSVGGFALSSAFEIKESYEQYFGPWNGTAYNLRVGIARTIPLAAGWSVMPSLLPSYQWDSTRTRERWKVEFATPVSYQLAKGFDLLPVMPSVSLIAFTHRRVGQRDWTLNMSTGVRYQVTTAASVAAAIGFEQRYSNVATSEFSRWLLVPKLQVRAEF